MRRKGFSRDFWVGLGIFLFVVGMLFLTESKAFGGTGGIFDFGRSLLGFNVTKGTVQQINIVGVELLHTDIFKERPETSDLTYFYSSPLKYYNGQEWILFEPNKKIMLGNTALKPEDARVALMHFYFYTNRYGEGLFRYSYTFNIRALVVKIRGIYSSLFYFNGGRMELRGEKRPGVITQETPPTISVDFNNRFYDAEGKVLSLSELPKGLRGAIISYRDQILEGGLCEKHLEIAGNKYRVKKLDNYLYIDLNEKPTEPEKYREGCFSSEFSASDALVENRAEIFILFDAKNGVEGLYWGDKPGGKSGCAKGWYILTDSGLYFPAYARSAGDFVMYGGDNYDFQKGLNLATDKLDSGDYIDILVGGPTKPDFEFKSGFGDFTLFGTSDNEKFKQALIKIYNDGLVPISDAEPSVEKEISSSSSGAPVVIVVSTVKFYDSLYRIETGKEIRTALYEPSTGAYQGWTLSSEFYKDGQLVKSDIPRPFVFPVMNYRSSLKDGLPYVFEHLYYWQRYLASLGGSNSYYKTDKNFKISISPAGGGDFDVSDKINPLLKFDSTPSKAGDQKAVTLLLDYYDLVSKGETCLLT